jgi:hypothetical protein
MKWPTSAAPGSSGLRGLASWMKIRCTGAMVFNTCCRMDTRGHG